MILNYSDVGKLVVLTVKQDWGPGQIMRIEDGFAYVRFRDCADKRLKKFSITDNLLFLATSQTDAKLVEIIEKDLNKRRPPAAPPRMLDFDQAQEIFKARYPQTFFNTPYKNGTEKGGTYPLKNLARDFHAAFGNGQLRQMVDTRSAKLLEERALSVLKDQDLIIRRELKCFKDLLKDEALTLAYFKALADILGAGNTDEASMKPYFEAVNACPVPGFANWPNATLFPFLARPERHMLLKPHLAQAFAAMMGNPLIYQRHPNWKTYSDLLEMAKGYLTLLKPMGAKDYLDVFAFMKVVLEGAKQKTTV